MVANLAPRKMKFGVSEGMVLAASHADEAPSPASTVVRPPNALGDATQKADDIARKFVADKVDLIHTIATPTTQAIIKTRTDIAVVFRALQRSGWAWASS